MVGSVKGQLAIMLIAIFSLTGCDKHYTPADFIKDPVLREKVLRECDQHPVSNTKNCQNARSAQQKIFYAEQQGKNK